MLINSFFRSSLTADFSVTYALNNITDRFIPLEKSFGINANALAALVANESVSNERVIISGKLNVKTKRIQKYIVPPNILRILNRTLVNSSDKYLNIFLKIVIEVIKISDRQMIERISIIN